ncbi:bifunctional 4-hydroxy-2-oxoglutarate aldolase/2-dehydro-3-deoxy-phosphogluconate aldolase [Rhodopseudomonas boonkerdii]|uniref:bifunctional 4-hydroxy-2-oxoglutarate aldolase/2-dehydro-3-deoxy-phosphogluconate aldolase n=1 Tax=Rhodopseudomonas boonkerdii TaxID=475937 RepID=UPI001E50E3D6|nr:bifunctional 4-hydroxy-2-oxoglutarate aldolase/2-dehydro-3-deoxy-phosphogluconate aldolase [Rhodopseudomonas boonkerdii]UGV26239.1 bifunctional 4-hydroxy-2-oxoglutarate aldolase/2-dehydro-3-deoxy-phosphogluconate aldolase [Rhodopseudomonas boonkerdii]
MTDIASRQDDLRKMLTAAKVIPVLTIERVTDAVPLAHALVAGGVHTLEITLRTAAAVEAAKAVIAEVPDAIVGIGTVLSAADFERAQKLGARFTVSPGATPALLEAAAKSDLPLLPGVATASEVMLARDYGFDTLKFFPAEQAGGRAMLRAWTGPFPDLRVCPTGGITEANAAEWLGEPHVLAVGGSWICPVASVRAGDWVGITAMCARTMKSLSPR